MTEKKQKITHEEAFARYLSLGSARSISKLYRSVENDDKVVPCSERSMLAWSGKFKWQARAAEFDAQASKRLVERTQTAMVQRSFDRVASLTNVAQLCLDVAGAARLDAEGLNAQDVKALVTTAIDAIKAVEVLTGGVSDRQERVGGIASEALRLLQEIEQEKRSHAKTIDITPTKVIDVDDA